MEAIILAGGLGTRLAGVVADVPKPMAPLGGRPFLEYQMDHWIGEGVTRFILSIGYKSEVIENHFGSSYKNIAIDYAVENEPLGTGGGLLLAAKRATKSPFLVLNGDTYFEVSLNNLLACHRRNNAELVLSLFHVKENDRYGSVELDDNDRVKSFKAKSSDICDNLINAGAYLMTSGVLDRVTHKPGDKISLEDEILPAMIGSGERLYGLPVENGRFIDIGIPDDYNAAMGILGKSDL